MLVTSVGARWIVPACAALSAALVAVGCGADAAAPASAGTTTTGTGAGGDAPATCPELQPVLGAACDTEGLSCSYGDQSPCLEPPRTCAEGRWSEQAAPAYCGVCPLGEPTGGSECGPPGLECTYPGQPMEHNPCDAYSDNAVCSPDGAWTLGTTTTNICDPCPAELPQDGAPCLVGEPQCPYSVDTPCGPRAVAAQCDLDALVWSVALPPCLCNAIVDPTVCAIAAGCAWVDLGACAAPGVYPACQPVQCLPSLCEGPQATCGSACDPNVDGCTCADSPLVCFVP